MKRYIAESESERVEALLATREDVVTGRHSVVEVRAALALGLPARQATARGAFEADLASMQLVELDEGTCELAAVIGETMRVRALDALHLGAAQRLGAGSAVTFLTYDVRQAQAARSLGFTVLGA